MQGDELTQKIIGCAIEVHRVLGPGLLESTYEACLCREFQLNEIGFERQKAIPVHYKGVQLDCGYRIDLLVENEVVVELKSVRELDAIYEAQLLSYLRLLNLKRGLLINFNVKLLKEGVKRLSL